MGRRNYLIEGISGAGKTTVAEELERLGHHVIHGDRVLAYYGDPETGQKLTAPDLNEADTVRWGYEHWIWPVDRVRLLIADRSHALSFFCGHSANLHRFVDLFDAVFLLDVDLATLDRRLAGRPQDEFGGRQVERELVLAFHGMGEGLPMQAERIDATAPVARIVDEILARCGQSGGVS